MFRNRHLLLADAGLLIASALIAFLLRLDPTALAGYGVVMLLYAPLAALLRAAILYGGGIYRRYWPFSTTSDMVHFLRMLAAGHLAVHGLVFLSAALGFPEPRVPLSIPVIDTLVATTLLVSVRLMVRRGTRVRPRHYEGQHRVLIVGAGEAGLSLLRELERNRDANMVPVGLVDDDPSKQRLLVNNVPVLGTRHDLPALVVEYEVTEVIIAMPSAPGRIVRDIVAICREANLPCRTMPSLTELAGGRVSVNQFRDVAIEDLLRREPVSTDLTALRDKLGGKTVAVTGAGGSIGSELCRQLIDAMPQTVLLIGHGEDSIYRIHHELTSRAPEIDWLPVISDVRDEMAMGTLFQQERPVAVFHAAAHKHVPLMESNPCEAILNNVFGAKCVVEAAAAANVEHFILISSDKAVNPSSVMGAAKRLAELVVQQTAIRAQRPYAAVRFGNVLGSSGSVVPLFQAQIAAGGPVTITHPEMTRYFMLIPEAVQLVLQATLLSNPAGGDVFVLDMGEPVRIVELAHDLIRLSGLEPDEDIEIVYTGLRPGEKLHEDLFIHSEQCDRTRHPKIMTARSAAYGGQGSFEDALQRLLAAARRHDQETALAVLRELIPTYRTFVAPASCVSPQVIEVRAGPAGDASSRQPAASTARGTGAQHMAAELLEWRAFPLDAPLRRALDVAISATLLILLAPLLALVALLVKLSSPGPVFYRGLRVGKDGVPFYLLKFRSMVVGADGVGPAITTRSDARITPVGRILRRTKLDELPQLWHVLTGTMSLVGPRPEAPSYVELYTTDERRILEVRPGITSAASIIYCNEEELLTGEQWESMYVNKIMREKLAIDLAYLTRRTVLKDVGILIRTALVIFNYDSEAVRGAGQLYPKDVSHPK